MNLFRRPVVNAHLPPRIVRAGVAFVALSIGLACSLLFRLFFGSGTFLLFFGAVAVIGHIAVYALALSVFSFPSFF